MTETGRIFIWVQHLFGIGPFVRAAHLARYLASRGWDVDLVSGGPPVRGVDTGSARIHQLPPVRAADATYSKLVYVDGKPLDAALEATRRTARALDVELHEIHVGATDFLDALPQAVRAVEVPLWNPHPVSKLLLGRALRREGFDAVLTGDAADQVLAGASGRDYLPLVGRLFHAEGIEPCSPFFDLGVLAHAAGRPADPDKTALRRVATRWLPRALTRARKAPRLFPELGPQLGVERLVGVDEMLRLAARLGLPSPRLDLPGEEGARSRCAHATLCLLWPVLVGGADPCAASSA